MKSVGIKNLKNNLSRYIDMVREGEVVYVTDRDKVVAEIHQPVVSQKIKSKWETFIEEETRKGSIIPAQKDDPNFIKRMLKNKPLKGAPSLQEIMDETRADRF